MGAHGALAGLGRACTSLSEARLLRGLVLPVPPGEILALRMSHRVSGIRGGGTGPLLAFVAGVDLDERPQPVDVFLVESTCAKNAYELVVEFGVGIGESHAYARHVGLARRATKVNDGVVRGLLELLCLGRAEL